MTRPGGKATRVCPRCGLRRQVTSLTTPDSLCRDCRYVEPHWPNIPGTKRAA